MTKEKSEQDIAQEVAELTGDGKCTLAKAQKIAFLIYKQTLLDCAQAQMENEVAKFKETLKTTEA